MSRKPKLKPLPWPKLSEQAAHEKRPDTCQCCGQTWDVDVYIECDEADRETTTTIAVCIDCAKRHVEPHARFYAELEWNRPFPGAMNCCIARLLSATLGDRVTSIGTSVQFAPFAPETPE